MYHQCQAGTKRSDVAACQLPVSIVFSGPHILHSISDLLVHTQVSLRQLGYQHDTACDTVAERRAAAPLLLGLPAWR